MKVDYSPICGLLPHSKFSYQLSQWNVPDYIRIRKIDLVILVTSIYLPDYAILGMMLYKNIMQYKDIEGLSATISDAWDRLTKNLAIVQ